MNTTIDDIEKRLTAIEIHLGIRNPERKAYKAELRRAVLAMMRGDRGPTERWVRKTRETEPEGKEGLR